VSISTRIPPPSTALTGNLPLGATSTVCPYKKMGSNENKSIEGKRDFIIKKRDRRKQIAHNAEQNLRSKGIWKTPSSFTPCCSIKKICSAYIPQPYYLKLMLQAALY
jgi:hypothetical protein